MKKAFAVLALVSIVASVGSAQDIWGSGKMRAGAGGYFSLPLGVWGDNYGIGFGGFGKFEYGLNEDMALQGSVGYITWMEKENAGAKSSANALAIDVAFKYNLSKIVTPGMYGVVSLGSWSIKQKTTGNIVNPLTGAVLGTITAELSQSRTVLAIGAGYDTGMLDINARYTMNENFGNILVGVAYNFGL